MRIQSPEGNKVTMAINMITRLVQILPAAVGMIDNKQRGTSLRCVEKTPN